MALAFEADSVLMRMTKLSVVVVKGLICSPQVWNNVQQIAWRTYCWNEWKWCNGCASQSCIPSWCVCVFITPLIAFDADQVLMTDSAPVTLRLACECERTDLVTSNLPLLKELEFAAMDVVRVEFSGFWHSQLTRNFFLFASIHLLVRQTKYCKTFENFHNVTKAKSWESQVVSGGNGHFAWTQCFDWL